MKPKYRIANQEHEVSPISRGHPIILGVNGDAVEIGNNFKVGNQQRFTINGVDYETHVIQQGNDIFVQLNGEHWRVGAINPIEAAGGSSASSDVILAPMPGTVVSLKSKLGDVVAEGATVLTIESMKLQTAIIAERAGKISNIYFSEGDTFDKGDELFRFASQNDEKEN